MTDHEWYNYFQRNLIDLNAKSNSNTWVSLDVRKWYDLYSLKSYRSKVDVIAWEPIGISELRFCRKCVEHDRQENDNRLPISRNSRLSRITRLCAQWIYMHDDVYNELLSVATDNIGIDRRLFYTYIYIYIDIYIDISWSRSTTVQRN